MGDGGGDGDGGEVSGPDCAPVVPEPHSGFVVRTDDVRPVVLGPGFSGHAVLRTPVRSGQGPNPADSDGAGERPV